MVVLKIYQVGSTVLFRFLLVLVLLLPASLLLLLPASLLLLLPASLLLLLCVRQPPSNEQKTARRFCCPPFYFGG